VTNRPPLRRPSSSARSPWCAARCVVDKEILLSWVRAARRSRGGRGAL